MSVVKIVSSGSVWATTTMNVPMKRVSVTASLCGEVKHVTSLRRNEDGKQSRVVTDNETVA